MSSGRLLSHFFSLSASLFPALVRRGECRAERAGRPGPGRAAGTGRRRAGAGGARHPHARRRLFGLRLRHAEGRHARRLQGRLPRRPVLPRLHLQREGRLVLPQDPTSARSPATPGATAGRVVADAGADAEPREAAAGELDFLSTAYHRRGARLVGALKRRYPIPATAPTRRSATPAASPIAPATTTRPPIDFGKALADRRRQSRPLARLRHRQPAAQPGELRRDAGKPDSNVTAAAINAYLRSDDDANRAAGARPHGQRLRASARSGSRPTAPTAPASPINAEWRRPRRTTRRSSPSTASASSPTTVDADSADPRICIVFSDKLAGDAARPRRFRHRRRRRRPRHRAERHPDLHQRHQARQPLPGARPRRPAVGRRRDARPSGRARRLCARPRAVGRLRRQRLCAAGRPGASIPIVSVNTDKAKATIYRIGDRGARRRVGPRRQLPPPARPLQPPTRSTTRPARRSGKARSASSRSSTRT